MTVSVDVQKLTSVAMSAKNAKTPRAAPQQPLSIVNYITKWVAVK